MPRVVICIQSSQQDLFVEIHRGKSVQIRKYPRSKLPFKLYTAAFVLFIFLIFMNAINAIRRIQKVPSAWHVKHFLGVCYLLRVNLGREIFKTPAGR